MNDYVGNPFININACTIVDHAIVRCNILIMCIYKPSSSYTHQQHNATTHLSYYTTGDIYIRVYTGDQWDLQPLQLTYNKVSTRDILIRDN